MFEHEMGLSGRRFSIPRLLAWVIVWISVAWTGVNGDKPGHPCRFQPCENGGSCISRPLSYYCVCAAGFEGRDCATPVDPCQLEPCQNGASCLNANGQNYECICPGGYTGPDCETSIAFCYSY